MEISETMPATKYPLWDIDASFNHVATVHRRKKHYENAYLFGRTLWGKLNPLKI